MTWARFDDQFYNHPKVAALGSNMLPCVGLHTFAICYCNAYLTDGVIPRGQVERLAGDLSTLLPEGHPWNLVNHLVFVGLWERANKPTASKRLARGLAKSKQNSSRFTHSTDSAAREVCETDLSETEYRGDYRIHDYLKYNPSRSEVMQLRETRALSGRNGGLAKAKQNASNSLAKKKQNSAPAPSPYLESKEPPLPPVASRRNGSALVLDDFEQFYSRYPRHVAPGAALRAWNAATKKATPAVMLAALEAQRSGLVKRPADKIPYPATWLNGEQWRNEVDPVEADDPYKDWPHMYDCAQCGEAHETRECTKNGGAPR